MAATPTSKDDTAARKFAADSLKSLTTYYSKHVDSTITDYIRKANNTANNGPVELSKSTLKAIHADALKRVDIYTRLTTDYLLKREKYTDFIIRRLSEEDALAQLATLVGGFVKYCELLKTAEIYGEPSDEDEPEEERRRQKAALSSEDRTRCLITHSMVEEGRMLSGLLTAIFFINSQLKHHQYGALLNQDGGRGSMMMAGGGGGGDSDADDELFQTVTLDYAQKSAASATASLFVRSFDSARDLIGLLTCTSDPYTQLNTLRVIGALAENDPIATIPFIANCDNGVSTIGQFVSAARVADYCGSHSNMTIRIQSSAVSVLAELTNPVAIDAAQKADAAASDSKNTSSTTPPPPEGGAPTPADPNTSMSGTLHKIIQGALAFDGCMEHLIGLAASQNGAFAKDEVAAQISETVAKTALAVPMTVEDGAMPSPSTSVARNEGSLTVVLKVAQVIANILRNNHQTTAVFLQMGMLSQLQMLFYVPPPFAAQCGDDILAPLPFYARNKGTRSASQVPTLGFELLLPQACDIVLQCLATGAHDQTRLEAQNQQQLSTASMESSAGSLPDLGAADAPPPRRSNNDNLQQRQTAPTAQMCIDQLLYQSSIGKSLLHHCALIGSAATRGDMIAITSLGQQTLRQMTRVLQSLVGMLRQQTRSTSEWLLRTDEVASRSPISQQHCSGYYGPALPYGKTAIASIIEDVCAKAPARGEPSYGLELLATLINVCPTIACEVIVKGIMGHVKQPGVQLQPLAVRTLATCLLPHLAHGGGAGGASSVRAGSPSGVYGVLSGNAMNFVAWLCDEYLSTLLGVADAPTNATLLPPSNRSATNSPALTPRASPQQQPPSSSTASTTTPTISVALNSTIAAAFFALSAIDVIASLDSMTTDELSMAENHLILKAAALARSAYEPVYNMAKGESVAPSVAALLQMGAPTGDDAGKTAASTTTSLSPTYIAIIINRLLSWLLLASLSHHNFSGRCESRVFKIARDVVRGVKGGNTANANTASAPTTPSKAAESSSFPSGGGGGRKRSDSIASLGSYVSQSSPLGDDEHDTLGLLLELIVGKETRALLQSADPMAAERGLLQTVAVLEASIKLINTSVAFTTGGNATATVAATNGSNNQQQQHLTADRSPYAAITRLVRGMCATGRGGRQGGVGGLGLLGALGGKGNSATAPSLHGGSIAGSIATAFSTSIGRGVGAADGGGMSSASSFIVMRDVVVRFVQMQSHSDEEEDRVEGGGGEARSQNGSAKFNASLDAELASQKLKNADLSEQLAAKEQAQHSTSLEMMAMVEAAAALLATRRRRVALMFPKFDSSDDDADNGNITANLSHHASSPARAQGGATAAKVAAEGPSDWF